MDGTVSNGSGCRHDCVLISLGDFEVLGEVVRSVAMTGNGCPARYVTDRSLLFYSISVFRITPALLTSANASLQPSVTELVMVLFTTT